MKRNKEERKREAITRNEAWKQLSLQDQLEDLDRRLGKGIGAKKQRTRILNIIDHPQVNIQRKAKNKKRRKKV